MWDSLSIDAALLPLPRDSPAQLPAPVLKQSPVSVISHDENRQLSRTGPCAVP